MQEVMSALKSKATAVVLVGACVVGGAVGIPLAATGTGTEGSSTVQPVSTVDAPPVGSLSSLEISPAAARLAERFAESGTAREVGIVTSSFRETSPGVFIANTSVGWLCVITIGQADGVPAWACTPQQELRKGPIVVESVRRDGLSDIAGIAPDGYQSVNYGDVRGTVRNNTFKLSSVESGGVARLSGPNLPDLARSLG